MTTLVLTTEQGGNYDLLDQSGSVVPVSAQPEGGGGAGSAGYVVWKPGGVAEGQVVTTLAEVQAAIALGAAVVFIDSSLAAATIESGETLSLGGFVALAAYHNNFSDTLHVADGGTIADWGYGEGLSVLTACTTSPAFAWSTVIGALKLHSCLLQLSAGAAVPAYKVAEDQLLVVFAQSSEVYGTYGADPQVPMFGCAAGGTLYLNSFLFCDLESAVAGDAGGDVVVQTDASTKSVHGISASPSGVPVEVVYLDQAAQLAWWSSDDAPTVPEGVTLTVGAMYFDTGQGQPLWWNGSTWVGAQERVLVGTSNGKQIYAGQTPPEDPDTAVVMLADYTPVATGNTRVEATIYGIEGAPSDTLFLALVVVALTGLDGGVEIATLGAGPTSAHVWAAGSAGGASPPTYTGSLVLQLAEHSLIVPTATNDGLVTMTGNLQLTPGTRYGVAVLASSAAGLLVCSLSGNLLVQEM